MIITSISIINILNLYNNPIIEHYDNYNNKEKITQFTRVYLKQIKYF